MRKIYESSGVKATGLALLTVFALSGCGQAAPKNEVSPQSGCPAGTVEALATVAMGGVVLSVESQDQLLRGEVPTNMRDLLKDMGAEGVVADQTRAITSSPLPPQSPGDRVYDLENEFSEVLGIGPLIEDSRRYDYDPSIAPDAVVLEFQQLGTVCSPAQAQAHNV